MLVKKNNTPSIKGIEGSGFSRIAEAQKDWKKSFNVISVNGWRYYNHAAVPATAPHEEPDLTPIKDGSIWHLDGKKPLLARWTTDWDCGYDTGWWYIIKDAPFDIEVLSKNSRKHIKEAFRKVRVKKINPADYVDALYECYHQAFLKYKQATNEASFERFKRSCENCDSSIDYFAGFGLESGKLIGYTVSKANNGWAEIITAKFDPRYLNLRVSDALYATVLDYYLNEKKLSYVSSGNRSINHVTNTQEYKESHFGYRKCFCKLNVAYPPQCKFMVTLFRPFRKIISFAGKCIGKAHLVDSVLKMDEIARNCKR